MEATYYISVMDMVAFIVSKERKIIPVEWCRDNGLRITQTKKRVRYIYDLSSWPRRYFEDVITDMVEEISDTVNTLLYNHTDTELEGLELKDEREFYCKHFL